MSEYIEFEAELTADPAVMIISTNLVLAEGGEEEYDSPAAMELGSPLAQMLSPIDGLVKLKIAENELIVTGDEQIPWHIIVAEITATIREFFL